MKHLKTFESFLDESAFHAALAKAKDEGLEEFEFNGEKYPVKKGALKESELNEADEDINMSDPYAMVAGGGSIGSNATPGFYDKRSRKIMSTHKTEEEAKEKAKRWTKMLSPGEKKYYGMSYSAVKLNPKDYTEKK
jgi:hypothetical protein